MTERERVFLAILADPWDGAAPLAYADILEEEGEAELAAFTREPFGVPPGLGRRSKEYRRRLALVRESLAGLVSKRCPLYLADSEALRAGKALTLAVGDSYWSAYPCYVTLVVRNGFVTEVGCTQALFLRVAAELFRRQPVRDVRLRGPFPADAFPVPAEESGRVCHSWNKGPASAKGLVGDVLAAPLFDLLTPGVPLRGLHRTGDNMGYPNALSAYLALSDACVRFGRRTAGLPPVC